MSAVKRLNASLRKRIGYCQKYGLSTSTDFTIMKLQNAIRQENIKNMRKNKRDQLQYLET